MSADEVKPDVQAPDKSVSAPSEPENYYFLWGRESFDTPYEWVRAEQDEQIRVVELIRAEIPRVSVYFDQGIVSVRASVDGATRDVVLMPGDLFTVTSTTVIRRPRP